MKLIDKTFVLPTYSGHTGHVKRQTIRFLNNREDFSLYVLSTKCENFDSLEFVKI